MAWERLENCLPWIVNRGVELEFDTDTDTDSDFDLHYPQDGGISPYPVILSKNRGYALDSGPLARYTMPLNLLGEAPWMSFYDC